MGYGWSVVPRYYLVLLPPGRFPADYHQTTDPYRFFWGSPSPVDGFPQELRELVIGSNGSYS
jgi:hypothetical protein